VDVDTGVDVDNNSISSSYEWSLMLFYSKLIL
jgi:hypothetical protein